jgi:hypothetical protein
MSKTGAKTILAYSGVYSFRTVMALQLWKSSRSGFTKRTRRRLFQGKNSRHSQYSRYKIEVGEKKIAVNISSACSLCR